VVRAEACAKDFYTALDNAIAKLDTRLRRSAERRRVSRGRRTPVSVAAATAALPPPEFGVASIADLADRAAKAKGPNGNGYGYGPSVEDEIDDQPWHLVREKEHPGIPMTVDDALFQMELIGHDFYLFMDKETGRPSVVYRRRAYDYGLLSLGV
jgi:hypothetical protein